jgi:2-polyprenyl-6-methoxyphenol hydroxylase-like FAD-dependent oxidoreductase
VTAPGDPVVIAGAGPAGLMLGLLLARAGVAVTVVEKHRDFLRDFRGDTLHPSTIEVMHEIGLGEALLALPHQRAERLYAEVEGRRRVIADFRRLRLRSPFIAFMPQWDFLDLLAREAARLPGFRLVMGTEAVGLVERGGRVVGIRVRGGGGETAMPARLVVAADGRGSALRDAAGLVPQRFGRPTDVLWFRLPKGAGDPAGAMGHFGNRQGFVVIDRGDYWQCGYVAKDGAAAVTAEGIEALRRRLAAVAPFPQGRLDDLASLDDVAVLNVRIDRLARWWRPGFLAIGDAAHAMSPIGGVGVNLAIQDAVAAANILARPLRDNRLGDADLAAVERRRMWPARATQGLQLMMLGREGRERRRPPALLRWLARSGLAARIAGRLVGVGFRPEHVRVAAAPPADPVRDPSRDGEGRRGAAVPGRPAP